MKTEEMEALMRMVKEACEGDHLCADCPLYDKKCDVPPYMWDIKRGGDNNA